MKVGDKVRVIAPNIFLDELGRPVVEGIITDLNPQKPYRCPIDVAVPGYGIAYFREDELEVIE